MGIQFRIDGQGGPHKADELPVHNRKGVGNQKEKGGGKFIEDLKG